jgi:hypothetical protein
VDMLARSVGVEVDASDVEPVAGESSREALFGGAPVGEERFKEAPPPA